MTSPGQLAGLPVDADVLRIALAAALGMFLGLEREWSHKSAGIRTFALISLLGAVFTIVDQPLLVVLGGVLVIVQGGFLAVQGIIGDDEEGLSLTTSVSMLVAYGVGALVAQGFVIEGVTVAVLSSLLLVLKELHSFAWGLSRPELRSATEFAILAAAASSVAVKAGLTLWGRNRSLTVRVAGWSVVVLALASAATAFVFL